MVILGSNLWAGDQAQGLRHYKPVDPNNTDPINTGQLMFDTATDWSIGGGTECIPWCSVGQIAQDGATRAYVTVFDHQKGAAIRGRRAGSLAGANSERVRKLQPV